MQRSHLAGHRLRLGISNVGFWVLAACTGLYFLVTEPLFAPDAMQCIGIGIGAIAVQSVFDFIGGVTLMPEPRPTAVAFFRGWSRGVIGHTLVVAAVGVAGAFSLQLTGGFGAAILLVMLALALGRRQVLRAIGCAEITERAYGGETILTASAGDPAFTGAVFGLGRRARSLVPARWIDTLPALELEVESSRRRWQIASALPARSFVLLLLWNLIGAFIGVRVLDPADQSLAVALLGHGCWMTLWAFVSLLVLPALSQWAVFAADQAAADHGLDPRAWIARFPDLVGEDGSQRTGVQTIFYPIPSAERRLRHLDGPASGFVPGDLARSNLYFSWATFTLLGRAVHCNVGRPVRWVIPPSA